MFRRKFFRRKFLGTNSLGASYATWTSTRRYTSTEPGLSDLLRKQIAAPTSPRRPPERKNRRADSLCEKQKKHNVFVRDFCSGKQFFACFAQFLRSYAFFDEKFRISMKFRFGPSNFHQNRSYPRVFWAMSKFTMSRPANRLKEYSDANGLKEHYPRQRIKRTF